MSAAEMINYTELADQALIEIFDRASVDVPDAVRLFSHLLNAQHIWGQRILGLKPLFGVWDIHPKENFKSIAEENFKLIRKACSETTEDQVIYYHTSNGTRYENRVDEILFHLFNHSTYHRGQVVTLLKHAGFTPPLTDYIMLKRNHLL